MTARCISKRLGIKSQPLFENSNKHAERRIIKQTVAASAYPRKYTMTLSPRYTVIHKTTAIRLSCSTFYRTGCLKLLQLSHVLLVLVSASFCHEILLLVCLAENSLHSQHSFFIKILSSKLNIFTFKKFRQSFGLQDSIILLFYLAV